MRAHELAKELQLSSKELLALALEMGFEVGNRLATVSVSQIKALREKVGPRPAVEPPPSPAPFAPPEAPAATPALPAAPPTAPEPPEPPPEPPKPKTVTYKGPVVLKDLATELGLKPNQLIAELMRMNVFASITQKLDLRVIQQIAEKHGYKVEQEKKTPEPKPPAPTPAATPPPAPKKKEKVKTVPEKDRPVEDIVCPPVVTFMGHVDHGKTSLLDKIRNAQVASSEDGGITQHIGAYTAVYKKHAITFLDTPGHAAFTAMRARGARLTDIAVLVVAADDGVMPQTREALQHAQAAGVCIVVAVNKCDLPSANPLRVRQQLQNEGLAPEDWGGTLGVCEVSATTGKGIEELLGRLILESEMLELKANPGVPAQGYVIEARMGTGMGPTATFLVKKGTLRVGDAVVCGRTWGRVKALINDRGERVKSAGPSMPVVCLGLSEVPEAGDAFDVFPNDRAARAEADTRQQQARESDAPTVRKVITTADEMLQLTDLRQGRKLGILLKTDVKGSLEAIENALAGIKSEKVSLHTLLTGVGNITENDVLLASASQARIIGFHVGIEAGVKAIAKHRNVEIRLYTIIYELLDDIRELMSSLLEPVIRENVIGHAVVRQVFSLGKKNRAAGCEVKDGRVTARSKARIERAGASVYEGSVVSLKRFQNDASEVREGQECGVRLDNFNDYQPGDRIEFYEIQKIAQEL